MAEWINEWTNEWMTAEELLMITIQVFLNTVSESAVLKCITLNDELRNLPAF